MTFDYFILLKIGLEPVDENVLAPDLFGQLHCKPARSQQRRPRGCLAGRREEHVQLRVPGLCGQAQARQRGLALLLRGLDEPVDAFLRVLPDTVTIYVAEPHHVLRLIAASLRRLAIPFDSSRHISLYATTLVKTTPKVALCLRSALLGGLTVPLQRFYDVLFNTMAHLIADTKAVL